MNNKDDVFTLASIHLTDDVIVLPLRYIVIIQPTESVVNSMHAIITRNFLDHFGFWKYFEYIECYSNNMNDKGDNISLIVERNKIEKGYYIGDIQGDYDATMKAGLEFIHAAYGFGTIRQTVPELSEFRKLPELLESL